MKTLAGRLSLLAPSLTIAMTALAAEMKAKGKDIISLTAGEPDFDTPDFIKQAATDALKNGKTKYTGTAGDPALIDAVRAKFKNENSLDYGKDEVCVTSGAKHAIYNALLALAEPGDEVLVPVPYWVTYPELVKFLGGKPVFVAPKPENGFKITGDDINRAVTKKTKALVLNTPCNPSGAVYTKKELSDIAEAVVRNDLYLVSDEVYEHITAEGRVHVSPASLPGMRERTFVINGVSKAFAMTGWRIGYMAGPAALIKPVVAMQGQTTHHASTPAMAAAAVALTSPEGPAFIRTLNKAFDERRAFMVEALNNIPGLCCALPEGAFYCFPDASALYKNGITGSMDLSQRLLDTTGVATVPGIAFGDDRHVRLSCAANLDNLKKAASRLNEGIPRL
ncbi:MAG: pyridoxal phosphate-dependent aminotransferase [Fibrobacterota bacterium]